MAGFTVVAGCTIAVGFAVVAGFTADWGDRTGRRSGYFPNYYSVTTRRLRWPALPGRPA